MAAKHGRRNDFLGEVDERRISVSRSSDPGRRSELGQFFTPAPVAALMSGLVRPASHVRLVDPGAGIGSLTAAVVAELCSRRRRPKSISVTAFEMDAAVEPALRETLCRCAELAADTDVKFSFEVVVGDFIEKAVEALQGSLFSRSSQGFNLAILNPPYKKLNSDSATRLRLREVGIETSNLYTAFMALCVRLLESDGQLVGITPTSFCNGPYFRPFREDFLAGMALERLHVFESRSSTFADDDVLQENVIVTATKGVPQADVTISSSEAGSLQPTMSRQVPFASVVRPSDPQRFIHVASEADADGIASKMEALTVKLPDLGLAVSTGRVVDFRAREYLRMQPTPGAGPLIYPTHFAEGVVRWPKESKKPNALLDVPETEPLWFPSGWYVLVKRFSSKEERRRVVACVFDPEVVRGPRVAFENHVNVFHEEGAGLPREVARGLALFLNSTIVDRYLRQFSGHTQVNATDLRSLKYPSRNALAVMGKKFATVSEQREIDDLVERALAPVWAA